MQNKLWMTVVMVGLMCAAAMSGCKKKTAGSNTGIGEGNIGGVTGAGIGETGLGNRPGDGTLEMAGQFAPVHFAFDSAQIQDAERAKVEAAADHLKKNTAGGVIVEGNCDERGSREYNLALGERRAESVRAYLINLGIDAARIQTKSWGKEKPVALGHDEESWSKNRRAEFVLFK